MSRLAVVAMGLIAVVLYGPIRGFSADPVPAQRLLLLYQQPDGHPVSTHEYLAGLRILNRLLSGQPGIEVRMVAADEPWAEGPELLDGADGAVLFLTAGAHWISNDPARLAAFQRLAERKGCLSCLHWGMGTKSAEPVTAFASLFGACHGGPDRKYQVLETRLAPATADHPVTRGIEPIQVHDEFYYALKTVPASKVTPLMQALIDDEPQMVAWGWNRPDGGRSFGFSGLHFHRHWERPEYRRLVTQGVLWSLHREIPADGVNVDLEAELLKLPPQLPAASQQK
ncbi:hypothetical protein GC163_18655 [bacterium]|nr:hypothetical protein [bacterium]